MVSPREHLGYFFLFDLCIKSPPFPREDLGGFNLIKSSLFKLAKLIEMEEDLGGFLSLDYCIKSPPFPREDLGGLFSLDLYLKVLSFKIILIQNDRLKCRTHPQPFPWKWKGVHMYYNYIFLTHYIPNHYLKVLPF